MKPGQHLIELIEKGKHDWIQTYEVVSVLVDRENTSDAILRLALMGLIAEMLISGLFVAGEIGDEGFSCWGGVVTDNIARAWTLVADTDVKEIGIGEGAWFNLTPSGEEVAALS